MTELGNRPDVHTAALVADPKTWQLLRFVLWADDIPANEQGERFEVMHVSTPDIHRAQGDHRCTRCSMS